MKEYIVKVSDNRTEWYRDGKLDRDSGPAIEWSDGDKHWYLEGIQYTEEQYRKKMNPKPSAAAPTCEGKVVEIDGIQYKLTAV